MGGQARGPEGVRGTLTFLRHLVAIILLPGTVLGLVPLAILNRARDARPGWGLAVPLDAMTLVAGIALGAVGLWLFVTTVRIFGVVGKGTLSPWDAPRHLVVHGPYRRVRNPMISGVLFLLAAEVVLSGSPSLLTWWLFFALLNAAFIPAFEEPLLLRKFGDEYRAYKDAVPRWIPRRTPWTPPWQAGDG